MAMPRPNEANLPPSPRNSLVSPRQTPRGAAKSLTSFRSLLLDCHTNIMRQLDREIFELDKGLKEDGKALNVPFRDPFVPLQPSDEPRSLEPRYSAHSGELCLSRAASLTVPEISEEGSEEEKGEKHVHVASFPTFSEVEEKRKKNMVWIQKQSRVTMVKEAYEAPATVMTKHQQKKVQKDAKQRFKSGAVFAHLSSDRIEEDVTDAALEKFGSTMVLDEEQSCVQQLAQNRWFERAALLLTLSNVIYISLDVEFNYSGLASESSTGFIVMDNIFCCLFLAELLVRFLAFPSRWLALRDPAFVFDSILVAMMIVEAWIMPLLNFIKSGDSSDVAASTILRIARVMRILRTARIAKLVRYMPELVILLKGMMSACRSVFFTLVLLVLVTYVFSITITEISRGSRLEEELFPSMGYTILTLIVQCVMPDLESRFKDAATENWFVGALWLTFIMFGTYIMMGLLVGILVETVKTVASYERKQLDVDFAKQVLWEMITQGGADQDGDNRISEVEFARLLNRPEAARALTILGVDISAALDYGHLLFEDGEPLTFQDFMEGMMTLRGSNQATVKDMVDLRKFMAEEFSNLHAVLLDMCSYLSSQGMSAAAMKRVTASVRYSRAGQLTHGSAMSQAHIRSTMQAVPPLVGRPSG